MKCLWLVEVGEVKDGEEEVLKDDLSMVKVAEGEEP
jgi:hypothetical protein